MYWRNKFVNFIKKDTEVSKSDLFRVVEEEQEELDSTFLLKVRDKLSRCKHFDSIFKFCKESISWGIIPLLILSIFVTIISVVFKRQVVAAILLWLFTVLTGVFTFIFNKGIILNGVEDKVLRVKDGVTESVPLHRLKSDDVIVLREKDTLKCNVRLVSGTVGCNVYNVEGKEYIKYFSDKGVLLKEGYIIETLSDDVSFTYVETKEESKKVKRIRSIFGRKVKGYLAGIALLLLVIMTIAHVLYAPSSYWISLNYIGVLLVSCPILLIPMIILVYLKDSVKGIKNKLAYLLHNSGVFISTKVKNIIYKGLSNTLMIDIKDMLVSDTIDLHFISTDGAIHGDTFVNKSEGQHFIYYINSIKELGFKPFIRGISSIKEKKGSEGVKYYVTKDFKVFDFMSTSLGKFKKIDDKINSSLQELWNTELKSGYVPLLCYYEDSEGRVIYDGIISFRFKVVEGINAVFRELKNKGVSVIVGTVEDKNYVQSIINQIKTSSKLFEVVNFDTEVERKRYIKNLEDEGNIVTLINSNNCEGIDDLLSSVNNSKDYLSFVKKIISVSMINSVCCFVSLVLCTLMSINIPISYDMYIVSSILMFGYLMLSEKLWGKNKDVTLNMDSILRPMLLGLIYGVCLYFSCLNTIGVFGCTKVFNMRILTFISLVILLFNGVTSLNKKVYMQYIGSILIWLGTALKLGRISWGISSFIILLIIPIMFVFIYGYLFDKENKV